MISYCPLDEIDTFLRSAPAPAPAPAPTPARNIPLQTKKETGFLQGEDTECNYLVLFFILGVLILACSDSVSIRR